MKKIIEFTLLLAIRIMLWFRYRIKVKGLENLTSDRLKRPGGVLFLPNHSAIGIDPLSVAINVWNKFPIRPVIVEYMYYAPVLNFVMRYVNAIPIPNNEVSSNSLKRKKSDQAFEEVIHGLKKGQNFMVYPAGKLKENAYETIAGASGVHRIISHAPEANVVLVRTTGLWGSSFSKAYTGVSPPLFDMVWRGIKKTFKNLLFFNPRRVVTIEFDIAPSDFPYEGDRMEINRYLENWYNGPAGKGEPLNRVSYSLWGDDFLDVPKRLTEKPKVNVGDVSDLVKNKVIQKLAEMTKRDPSTIKPEMDISTALSLDSLDMAEIALFLETEFDLKGVPVKELKTVGRVMEIAARKVQYSKREETGTDVAKWHKQVPKQRVEIAPGKIIPEVFLNNCAKWKKTLAIGDDRSGIMNYQTFKLRVLILADQIRKMPGKNIGVMLPASVAATLTVLACQMAAKVPVMINWTVGRRHLDTVVETSQIEVVLSSWTFLDRLGNVEIQPIEDLMVMLEDVRRNIGIKDKIRALFRSRKGTQALLKEYQLDQLSEDEPAAILYTSGTEAQPKGVPLSHKNLISNIKAPFKAVELYTTDIFLAKLPPFHSFGLSSGCYFGPLSGMRAVYYPNPTEGDALAKTVQKWGATVVCDAPTFLKGMLKSAKPDELKSLRLVVTGAEKAPPELMVMLKDAGLEGRLLEGYGVTECSPFLCLNRPGHDPAGVGEPLDGVDILIVHEETHEPLSTGAQGLVLARGPNVFAGYLNKGLKSPFLTVNGQEWYNTGDLGYLDEMGRLILSGRLKRFIKTGGEMISLAAIEDTLLKSAPKMGWKLADEGPSLAVCAKENGGGKPDIVLFTLFDATLDQVNNALREAGFSNLVRISEVKKIEHIPLMGSGKIFYRELESKFI